jgi:hypothetical protein
MEAVDRGAGPTRAAKLQQERPGLLGRESARIAPDEAEELPHDPNIVLDRGGLKIAQREVALKSLEVVVHVDSVWAV